MPLPHGRRGEYLTEGNKETESSQQSTPEEKKQPQSQQQQKQITSPPAASSTQQVTSAHTAATSPSAPAPTPTPAPVSATQTASRPIVTPGARPAAVPPSPVPPSRPQVPRTSGRRTFLKALLAVGAVLSIIPFVPWGTFLSSSVESGSSKPVLLQKLVITTSRSSELQRGSR